MKTHTITSIVGLALAMTANAQDPVVTLETQNAETVQIEAAPAGVMLEVEGGAVLETEFQKHLSSRMEELKGLTKRVNGEALDDVVRWSVADAGSTPAMRVIPAGSLSGSYIGVSVNPVSAELSGQISLPENTGLVVNHLGKDGPAEKAGLQKGDVLGKLDDQILIHPQQLSVLIGNKKEGESVKLTYLRKGQSVEANVVIGKREAGKEASGSYRFGDTDVIIEAEAGRPIRTYTKTFGTTKNVAGVPATAAEDEELAKKLQKIEASLEELKKALSK